jgi:hypothetical protein
LVERHRGADCGVDGETTLFEHANCQMKVFGESIARAEDIKFFLHEQAGLVGEG